MNTKLATLQTKIHPKKLSLTELNQSGQNPSDLNIWYCEFPEDEILQKLLVAEYVHLLPENLLQAHWGRKTEYIAGRLAAKAALAEAGIADYLVRSHEDRSPIWPVGVQGSITHKKRLALAAVSTSHSSVDKHFLGIDLELPMTEKAANKLARKIIDDTEKQLLRKPGIKFEEAFTRTFSAKEALYKAVYPYVKRYLPFSVCQVTRISQDNLTLQLQPDLAKELQHHIPFDVQTTKFKEHFLSVLTTSL